jgi:hypothetical protein
MDASGTFETDDSGIETPVGVGTDERRMHVRAYNYWVSLLSGRAYPSIEDLEPSTIDDFGPNSVLLDFTSGTENPTIAFLGNALRHECDLPVGVASVADIPRSSLLSRLTDHYLQIIANRAPIGFEAEFNNDRGNNTMYRGILMPFSSDDDTIDFIYGVINWKEGADEELTAGIIDEVERALLAAPKRATAAGPVWADGPSRNDAPGAPVPTAIFEVEEEGPEEEPAFVADGTEALGDWLAAARSAAEAAVQFDQRSRHALYRALSHAYDFALAADARADEFAELLADSGITAQARAPMTPVVKLVFGVTYDKTRLAEYGLALMHGRRHGLGQGALLGFLEGHVGGLKGVVQAERVERRPAPSAAKPATDYRTRARALQPTMIVPFAGDDEFVLLVARRIDGEHVAMLGAAGHDDVMLQKALRTLAR